MRARNLKPSFFSNEDLGECEPLARLLFEGLWCMADAEGRLENRPKRIKAQVLPFDDCDIVKLLGQLESKGFIESYTASGVACIQVVNFLRHAKPHPKERSTLPSKPEKGSAQPNPKVHGSEVMGAESLLLNPEVLNVEAAPKSEASYSGQAADENSPGWLARVWCNEYRGPFLADKDARKVSAAFAEWIESGVMSSQRIRDGTAAKRDRTESLLEFKKRLTGGAHGQSRGSVGSVSRVRNDETEADRAIAARTIRCGEAPNPGSQDSKAPSRSGSIDRKNR